MDSGLCQRINSGFLECRDNASFLTVTQYYWMGNHKKEKKYRNLIPIQYICVTEKLASRTNFLYIFSCPTI